MFVAGPLRSCIMESGQSDMRAKFFAGQDTGDDAGDLADRALPQPTRHPEGTRQRDVTGL